MNDFEIRRLLLATLKQQRYKSGYTVLEELRVGKGSVRADIVLMSDELECFEIKSAKDSLTRLQNQGWHYGRTFNKVNLVVATNHLTKACSIIPRWWGVWEVTEENTLIKVREPQKNPLLDPIGLSELLSQNECKFVLKNELKIKGYSKLSCQAQHLLLADSANTSKLTELVIGQLKERKPDLMLVTG